MKQQQLINNNIMRKKLCLVLFVLISANIIVAQNNTVKDKIFRSIGISEIQSEYFRKMYGYFQSEGFLKLPAYFDKGLMKYLEENNLDRMGIYPYRHTNGESPFYVNISKTDKERYHKETFVPYLYNETNGNYVLGVIEALSEDHIAIKDWLVTFDFFGNLIDYIPIHEYIGDVCTNESQINSDFTVNIQRLDFPDNDCFIKDFKPLDNLKGQRIDTNYEITTDGKFKKLNEVRYQPQIYPPATLLDRKVNIRDRGERKM